MATINALFEFASRILLSLERHFYTYLRIAIFVVMAWIGGLKVCQYEADGIVPFVSNSPFMSFLYNNSSKTAINPKNGTLTKIGYQLTGIHPRNFAITPNGKYLLVACRDNNKIQVFQRNEATGKLTETSQEIEVDKPTCIVFGKSN